MLKILIFEEKDLQGFSVKTQLRPLVTKDPSNLIKKTSFNIKTSRKSMNVITKQATCGVLPWKSRNRATLASSSSLNNLSSICGQLMNRNQGGTFKENVDRSKYRHKCDYRQTQTSPRPDGCGWSTCCDLLLRPYGFHTSQVRLRRHRWGTWPVPHAPPHEQSTSAVK